MFFSRNFKKNLTKKTIVLILLGIATVLVSRVELSAESSSATVNLEQLEQECYQNDWNSCQKLTEMYLDIEGEGTKAGVKKDINKGLGILERSCNLASGEAQVVSCFGLSMSYMSDEFRKDVGITRIKKDINKGLGILEKSCTGIGKMQAMTCGILGVLHGFPKFQKKLGVKGMRTNKKKARKFLQKSCRLGNDGSCNFLKDL